jgi:transposase
LAALIQRRWGIQFNANYLVEWLTARSHSPQKPVQPAKERDEAAIARWREEDWPRLQKKPEKKALTSSWSTRAASFLIPWCGAPGRRKEKRPCYAPLAATATKSRPSPPWAWLRFVGGWACTFARTQRTTSPPKRSWAFCVIFSKHLRGRVIVVWDGGSNHKGPLIRALCSRFPRLHLEPLPAYAPELNPVEFIWSHLKYGRMANFVPRHVRHLKQVVQTHLHEVGQSPGLLKQLWKGSKLPFPVPAFT